MIHSHPQSQPHWSRAAGVRCVSGAVDIALWVDDQRSMHALE